MKVSIQHQEAYSRSELLLRTFLGAFYIGIPHIILMMFYAIWVAILQFFAWFAILFTTKYPRSAFDAYIGLQRWNVRLSASLGNLVDGYPPFGPSTRWEKADFDIGYPEKVTRKRLLFVTFLGSIALIPHLFVFYFLSLAISAIYVVAFFIVLFTGKYPQSMFDFSVGSLRWAYRIQMYASYLYFKYPEFSLEETETDKAHMPK